ncbi:hypothetical protein PROG_00010 [Prochlorococcus phage P-SSP10]|uniref:Uncharacterized protein n=1 Tax=Prochlorococcus phage P-SSP10 TaxID=885867 RepID=M1UAQ2_9CAUD|nr:hypothetical protein PROG_00010 [Prochlorococcus phage P-SSP10]AGG54666.1 hypothetical protein PROG_00010 [Prochlorococcus phage P-SSP10]
MSQQSNQAPASVTYYGPEPEEKKKPSKKQPTSINLSKKLSWASKINELWVVVFGLLSFLFYRSITLTLSST